MSDLMRAEGFADLDRRLAALGQETGGRTLRAAMMAAMRATVVKTARALAPTELAMRVYGFGKKHLVVPGTLKREIRARVDRRASDETSTVVTVGPSRRAWYGKFPELGTRHQRAQPYLRPALELEADNATAALRDQLITRIEKVATS